MHSFEHKNNNTNYCISTNYYSHSIYFIYIILMYKGQRKLTPNRHTHTYTPDLVAKCIIQEVQQQHNVKPLTTEVRLCIVLFKLWNNNNLYTVH